MKEIHQHLHLEDNPCPRFDEEPWNDLSLLHFKGDFLRWKALSQITSQLISLIVQSLSKDFLKLKSNIWLICESKNRHSHILNFECKGFNKKLV